MASSNQERIGRATKQLSYVGPDGGAIPAVAGCCGKLSGTVVAKDRTADGKIKGEFEDSMVKLNPLLACIEATDRFVDQIVYRLYGLTEE